MDCTGKVGLVPDNVQLVNVGRQKAIKLVIRIRIRYWDFKVTMIRISKI